MAFALALLGVLATRWPVMRLVPVDYDEINFIEINRNFLLPAQHTLFLAGGRILGNLVGDGYRGIILLDMLMSALALTSAWWWLRSLVKPSTAIAATVVLGVGPVFWAYGAMAGNYTAIVAVGCFLLGIATRTHTNPRPWHPFAAAAVLAVGTGYRSDIGTLWLPVFFVILWHHRWRRAFATAAFFTVLNLAWITPMVINVGGWEAYSAQNREFAYRCGYLNSIWNLGFVDAPVRYGVKAAMALVWTLGPGLLFAPRGMARLLRQPHGRYLAAILVLCILPPLASHLLVHFGVPGYAFHYVPALLMLVTLGIGRAPEPIASTSETVNSPTDQALRRLSFLAAAMAVLFWFYPGEYKKPGLKSDFDLAFARHTRAGLRVHTIYRTPSTWRTANSVPPLSPSAN
ncbi:glycosyltransferase family 39 protein [Singulisphaera sp. PoT]|uniref:glycosyltransferase family 39 protein n=1 Tax=Singulisphaera sp. PoT TaxID=3411797 RepID=UPI003BF5B936